VKALPVLDQSVADRNQQVFVSAWIWQHDYGLANPINKLQLCAFIFINRSKPRRIEL
jgi:hypothetical protein